MESAYVALVRSGIQPSEVWKMTWPEFMVLQIAAREDEANQPAQEGSDKNHIHCDSFEDFALALGSVRGSLDTANK